MTWNRKRTFAEAQAELRELTKGAGPSLPQLAKLAKAWLEAKSAVEMRIARREMIKALQEVIKRYDYPR